MEDPPIVLQEGFVRRIMALDKRGDEWLKSLPALLADCAGRWSLTVLEPFPNLTYHYVAPVIYPDGTEAVLKTGLPTHEVTHEAMALRVFDGASCVRLLDADVDHGVMVLERLQPGTTLVTLANEADDAKATSLAASVMRGLWRPVPAESNFPTAADWGKAFQRVRLVFNGGVGPFPRALFEQAETLFGELVTTSAAPVLLHGDLHHDNILSAGRLPWIAIDPKGVIGEPAYETGAILRNLWQDRHAFVDPKRILERRIHQFADELDMDRARIHNWAIAQAVLSACWGLEDDEGHGWQWAIAVADLLKRIKM